MRSTTSLISTVSHHRPCRAFLPCLRATHHTFTDKGGRKQISTLGHCSCERPVSDIPNTYYRSRSAYHQLATPRVLQYRYWGTLSSVTRHVLCCYNHSCWSWDERERFYKTQYKLSSTTYVEMTEVTACPRCLPYWLLSYFRGWPSLFVNGCIEKCSRKLGHPWKSGMNQLSSVLVIQSNLGSAGLASAACISFSGLSCAVMLQT